MQVFYHICCLGNWETVVISQLRLLKEHNIDNINVCILGKKLEIDRVILIAQKIEINLDILYRGSVHELEYVTIQALQDNLNSENDFVLYLHTKGVSDPTNLSKQDCRKLMGQLLIPNLKFLTEEMASEGYEAAGFNWIDVGYYPHFRGNFWLATTKYLKTLEDFQLYKSKVDFHRVAAEYWIGSGNPKALSLGVTQNPYTYETDICTHLWEACKAGTLPLIAKPVVPRLSALQ
jgi:hypothetical protein